MLGQALLVLKEMEENIRTNLAGQERLQALPVAMNNLAYFYYRKHKYPAAHSYMTKAMTLELTLTLTLTLTLILTRCVAKSTAPYARRSSVMALVMYACAAGYLCLR